MDIKLTSSVSELIDFEEDKITHETHEARRYMETNLTKRTHQHGINDANI